jgi:hypothetical protein
METALPYFLFRQWQRPLHPGKGVNLQSHESVDAMTKGNDLKDYRGVQIA